MESNAAMLLVFGLILFVGGLFQLKDYKSFMKKREAIINNSYLVTCVASAGCELTKEPYKSWGLGGVRNYSFARYKVKYYINGVEYSGTLEDAGKSTLPLGSPIEIYVNKDDTSEIIIKKSNYEQVLVFNRYINAMLGIIFMIGIYFYL